MIGDAGHLAQGGMDMFGPDADAGRTIDGERAGIEWDVELLLVGSSENGGKKQSVTANPEGGAMLQYDHDRTEKIVERLRNAEGIVRIITIASPVALLALTGLAATRSAEGMIFGGVIGAGIGFVLGNYSKFLLSAVIEWMCQMLIAQGEVIEASKRSRKV